MSDFDYGPLKTYEITWASGHVERILAHQVHWDSNGGGMLGMFADTKVRGPQWVRIHASIEGRWTLQLQAREDDIRTIRNVTYAEPVPGGDAA